jgi:hypothetical protein
MTTPSLTFSGSPKNNANLAKSPQVINAMNLGIAMRDNLVPWREVARELCILKDNGEPDTGLAYKIVMEGYEPKTLKTRTRLGWPPVCPTCYQPLPKPPRPARVVRFDPAQMDAVITFLRAHERPLPRVYARGGKLVKS